MNKRGDIVMRMRIVLVLAILVLTSCHATQQPKTVATSGYLGDYSMMREGKKGQAMLVYVNPETKWVSYNKIMLDPVTVWHDSRKDQVRVSPADLQRLADYFYSILYQELAKDYTMVRQPESGAMRMTVALVHAEKSMPFLSVISDIPGPYNFLALASTVKSLTTGKPLFVGEAGVEGKITDSMTGELLGAAVDRRVGGKLITADKIYTWGDAELSLKYWSERIRYKLCLARTAQNCQSPD